MSETDSRSHLIPKISSSSEDDSDNESIEEVSFPTNEEMYHAYLAIEDRMEEKADKLPVIRKKTAHLFCVFCFIFHSNPSHACEYLNKAEKIANGRLSQRLEGYDTFDRKLFDKLLKLVKTEGENYANESAGKTVNDVPVAKRSVTPKTARIVSKKKNVSSQSAIPIDTSRSAVSKRLWANFVSPSLPEDKSEWTREHYVMEAFGPDYINLQAVSPDDLKGVSPMLMKIYKCGEKRKGKKKPSEKDVITIEQDSDESEESGKEEVEDESDDSEEEEESEDEDYNQPSTSSRRC